MQTREMEMQTNRAEARALRDAYLDRYAQINGFKSRTDPLFQQRKPNPNEICVEDVDGDAWDGMKQRERDLYMRFLELA